MGRADVPLKVLSAYMAVIFFAWFICNIIISSLHDTSQLLLNSNAVLNGEGGTLSTITMASFYHWGAELVIAVLVVISCWLAAYGQTRQLRAMALFATIWGFFAWFIYSSFVFQAFSSGWNCGSLAALGSNGATRWCNISKAASAFSVCQWFGKLLLIGWATFRFFQLRNQEPFCELDKAEIQYEQMKQAGVVLPQQSLPPVAARGADYNLNRNQALPSAVPEGPAAVPVAAGEETHMLHVRSTPVGLFESDAPIDPARTPITALDQQRLGVSGSVVLFFCGLTLLGYIISMLSYISLNRWDNYNAAGGKDGDQWFAFNFYFTSLTLFFAVPLGALAAYDRVRGNAISPMFLTFITACQLWGLVVYSLRRARFQPGDGTTGVAWHAQVAQAAGLAIMTFSETLRIGALAFKAFTSIPALHPHEPAAARSFGSLVIWFCQSIYILLTITWTIVMIVMGSLGSLFDTGISGGNPLGLNSPQDIVQWSYHNLMISLMIMAVFFATNTYINLVGTRAATLSSYLAQVVCTAGWWIMCFPSTYSSLNENSYMGSTYCGAAYSSSVCRVNRAAAVLSIMFFATFVVNCFFSLIRLCMVDFASRSALPAAELKRQGSIVTRREALARGTLGFGDTWISAELLLWPAVAGWLIYTFGATEYGLSAFFALQQVTNGTIAFELYNLLSSHFLTISTLLNLFIQAHMLTNKTYRDHSYGFRYAQFTSYAFEFFVSIPMLILIGRYKHLNSFNASQMASFAGLVIFVGAQFFSLCQFSAYCFLFPASPVTVMAPSTNVAYDKAGNPVVGAIPLDVEKGETLNPHHDQAGLGTNYTKTDYRHQDNLTNAGNVAGAPVVGEKEMIGSNSPTDRAYVANNERNTAITGGPTMTPMETTQSNAI